MSHLINMGKRYSVDEERVGGVLEALLHQLPDE